jgi:hypothetical protein
MWNAVGGHCTSRQHNTHITASHEVLYRWHPWYGRKVWVFNTVEKNGETVLRCALDSLETSRVSEVPQWMFDPLACCRITFAIHPVVSCEALHELKRLLADRSLAHQTYMVQAEHHPFLRTGGADATRDEPATGRSTRPVSSLPEDTTVGAPAAGGTAADGALAGTIAAATSTRALSSWRGGDGRIRR